jgi:hypothetical protein
VRDFIFLPVFGKNENQVTLRRRVVGTHTEKEQLGVEEGHWKERNII